MKAGDCKKLVGGSIMAIDKDLLNLAEQCSELIISLYVEQNLSIRSIARKTGISAHHICIVLSTHCVLGRMITTLAATQLDNARRSRSEKSRKVWEALIKRCDDNVRVQCSRSQYCSALHHGLGRELINGIYFLKKRTS